MPYSTKEKRRAHERKYSGPAARDEARRLFQEPCPHPEGTSAGLVCAPCAYEIVTSLIEAARTITRCRDEALDVIQNQAVKLEKLVAERDEAQMSNLGHVTSVVALRQQRDALTARVSELEKERARWFGSTENHTAQLDAYVRAVEQVRFEAERRAEVSDFILRVLRIFADSDNHDAVWWRTDGLYGPVTFFVNCNDVFAWACADLEKITHENIGELERAIADCRALGFEEQGPTLFCCRVRKMRPQGCAYPSEPALWPLFDTCGPRRELDLDNPKPHPADATGARP